MPGPLSKFSPCWQEPREWAELYRERRRALHERGVLVIRMGERRHPIEQQLLEQIATRELGSREDWEKAKNGTSR